MPMVKVVSGDYLKTEMIDRLIESIEPYLIEKAPRVTAGFINETINVLPDVVRGQTLQHLAIHL